jgi:Na+/alanine symporter
MTGAVAVSVLLVAILAELHFFAVARNRRVARRRNMLAPLMAALFLVFGAVVVVTIGEALGAK